MINPDHLRGRFAFHPANSEKRRAQHQEVRERCYALALAMNELVPSGRHAALGLTALEEAMHWFNAALACDSQDHEGV